MALVDRNKDAYALIVHVRYIKNSKINPRLSAHFSVFVFVFFVL